MKSLAVTLLTTFSLCFSAAALAAPIIELKDGSRIQGDIQSVENGEYTIQSPSMGTLRISQSNILRIVYAGSAETTAHSASDAAAGNSALANQALQLQAQLASDPGAMRSILDLQSDPQIQAILNDPQIMQAIGQGDYAGLLNNPKIQALDNNAQLKRLLRQLGQ